MSNDYIKKHQDELKSSLSFRTRTNNKTRKKMLSILLPNDSPITVNDNLSNKDDILAGNSLILTLAKL